MIEREILQYLEANPAAQDTARGIAEWWLLKQIVAQSSVDVEAALARLVAEGKLTAQERSDGYIHFSLPEPG
jgi:hypothetical protein